MKRRALIIPAAGLGTRLHSPLPKLLVPVRGIPMIDRLQQLYAGWTGQTIIVTNPAARLLVEDHVERRRDVDVVVQDRPTGMLDAITIGAAAISPMSADSVWVTWCDQVAVHPNTVARLAQHEDESPTTPLILPTVRIENPYIHLERDAAGRISRVLHRREGDDLPQVGESDMGLFALTAESCFHLLPQFASGVVTAAGTGERNFLPFIPWVAQTWPVITFPSEDPEEAIGVNTPDDLRAVEAYLERRGG